MSQNRIREWYNHWDGDVCVSFSGGKDSTVLAHLVHDIYPNVPLIFANTGLEYPEIQAFARKMGAEFVRPKMQFSEVISTYGYPIISKENAEAIYYARRIRNGGGYATADRKRDELNGCRPGVNDDDGCKYLRSKHQRAQLSGSNLPYAEWKNSAGGAKRTAGEQTLQTFATHGKPPVMQGGGVQQETVRRNLLMGGNGKIRRTGVDGSHGEETASPG